MKPGRFEYLAPMHLDEAVDLLAANGDEASILAGGQSLVPAMNFRLATPAVLIDINRVSGLGRVRAEGDELAIDALVRHQALESVKVDDPLGRLLARISHFVGHLPVRVRGTFVGSIAHADPAAEWCMLTAALDSTIVVRSVRGQRRLASADFFQGSFTTARAPDEMITEVRLPLLRRAGTGFREKAHTAGDFATVATVATLTLDDGVVSDVHIGIAGAEPRPVRPREAERVLVGRPPEPDVLLEAAEVAADAIDPVSDAFCSADYRRHLARVLVRRALDDAAKEAAA